MKKSRALFLCSVGLALVIAGPAFAQGERLCLRSQTATRIFNDDTRQGRPAGPGMLPNGSVGSSGPVLAANNQARDGATTAKSNTSRAMLSGALLLLLLQRRYQARVVLRPRSSHPHINPFSRGSNRA